MKKLILLSITTVLLIYCNIQAEEEMGTTTKVSNLRVSGSTESQEEFDRSGHERNLYRKFSDGMIMKVETDTCMEDVQNKIIDLHF